jgi:sulfite reductase beta subunit-like hemoprotein
MIRVRLPAGVCTPAQWLAMDQIADEHGSGHFKLTTRQTFQFHGVIKKHLKPSIQAINRALLDTLAACGDVNRYALRSNCCGIAGPIPLPLGMYSARRSHHYRICMRRCMRLLRVSANTFCLGRLRIMKFGWTRNW